MSQETASILGIAMSGVVAFMLAIYRTRSTGNSDGRSASASEVIALGARLDTQVERIDSLERRERALREYIADDHTDHRAHGWPIKPLPPEVA